MRTTTVFTSLRPSRLLALCAPMLLPATAALAQDEVAVADEEDVLEEIVVTGMRRTIQDSINLKRNSITIVDGLSADEIGALPALSIGEALETVTGAATHRENGGATEVAIRGLGPYLGTTTVNVRESTNGSGNRGGQLQHLPFRIVQFHFHSQDSIRQLHRRRRQRSGSADDPAADRVRRPARAIQRQGFRRIPTMPISMARATVTARPSAISIHGKARGWEISAFPSAGQVRDDSNPEAEATHGTGGGAG